MSSAEGVITADSAMKLLSDPISDVSTTETVPTSLTVESITGGRAVEVTNCIFKSQFCSAARDVIIGVVSNSNAGQIKYVR